MAFVLMFAMALALSALISALPRQESTSLIVVSLVSIIGYMTLLTVIGFLLL